MPRSFLLRRSFNAQGDGRSNNATKILLKGCYKASLTNTEEENGLKHSYGGNEKNFWPNEQTKTEVRGPFTYQSYIDGDMIKTSKNLMKTQTLLPPTDIVPSQLEILNGEAAKLNAASTEIPTTPGTKPIYRCEQCGKTFKTKYTLTIHLKMPSHTGARPFVCNICGKGFRLSSTLCRHKIIHTTEKPHKCQICHKAFNRSSTLKTHVRTHSERKEFVCDVCGKGFHQKGNLRNHFLIHTGEKPYNCRLCNKAFNKLSNLKFHLHVHTDNTPYRCRYCKTAFSRRCDLKQHIQNSHDGKRNDYLDSDEM